MIIDAALNPAEIALLPSRDLSQTTCVVFDILRATSSMVTALAHGAAAIHPVRTIEEALSLREKMPDAILCGERHGDRIDGFALGNSPFEYRDVSGERLISTTTNGTVALRAVEGAERVLVGAILNLAALAAEIRRAAPSRVLLVCAGTFEEFALEDACAAGLLIQALGADELTDAARATLAVAQSFARPIDALRAAKNGRVLIGKGRGEEVDWCGRVSEFSFVGVMESATIWTLRP